MKDKNITIEFTAIMDYIKDKDIEIDYLRYELDKYKTTIDKIKEYMKNRKEEYNNANESRAYINSWHYCKLINDINELLEEIE